MIPVLLIAGLVVGRWWLVPVGAVLWPALLLADGVDTGSAWQFAAAAGVLAAANVAVPVALRRVAAYLLRLLKRFLDDPIGQLGATPGPRA